MQFADQHYGDELIVPILLALLHSVYFGCFWYWHSFFPAFVFEVSLPTTYAIVNLIYHLCPSVLVIQVVAVHMLLQWQLTFLILL